MEEREREVFSANATDAGEAERKERQGGEAICGGDVLHENPISASLSLSLFSLSLSPSLVPSLSLSLSSLSRKQKLRKTVLKSREDFLHKVRECQESFKIY